MRLRNVVMMLVALLGLMMASGAAWAEDVIKLRNGEEVRGEIVRELDGSVWLIESFGTVKRERFFAATQIIEVVKGEKADAPAGTEEKQAARSNVPKAAVISLEGMVGLMMTSDKLRDLIPILEEELGNDGTGIVVFKVNSGGGALLEIQRLSDVIENEYKPKFQVVAWIESAISAAAMTAHCIEEIYFLPEGNYGACTGWSGQLTAVKGLDYEQVIFMMEKISDRGGYDPRIMKAMQGHWREDHFNGAWPLSCSIDDKGNVTWYQDADSGEKVINPNGDVLTFNAVVAKEVGFSRGTARSIDELTRLMGYEEIEWVGKSWEGKNYPVGRAEAEMLRFREKAEKDESGINDAFSKFQINLQAASGSPADVRGRFIGRARTHLSAIQGMIRNNPNLALFGMNMLPEEFPRWVESQEEILRELARRP